MCVCVCWQWVREGKRVPEEINHLSQEVVGFDFVLFFVFVFFRSQSRMHF